MGGRETSVSCLCCALRLETEPITQACALTGNRTSRLLFCRLMFQPAEPHLLFRVSRIIFVSKRFSLPFPILLNCGHCGEWNPVASLSDRALTDVGLAVLALENIGRGTPMGGPRGGGPAPPEAEPREQHHILGRAVPAPGGALGSRARYHGPCPQDKPPPCPFGAGRAPSVRSQLSVHYLCDHFCGAWRIGGRRFRSKKNLRTEL